MLETGSHKQNGRAILERTMFVDRSATAADAIESLLGDPWLARLTAAHRVLEPEPPRHAPWPEGPDPRLVNAPRSRGVEARYTHHAHAVGAGRARRHGCAPSPTGCG